MNNGGPAFPDHIDTAHFEIEDFPGMSLRDWFAGQALSGLIGKYNLKAPGDQDTVSKMAYELADAMLTERS